MKRLKGFHSVFILLVSLCILMFVLFSCNREITKRSDCETTKRSDLETTQTNDLQTTQASDRQTTQTNDRQTTQTNDRQTTQASDREITQRSVPPKLVSDLRRLAVELSETQRSLIHSPLHFFRVGRNIELVHGMIKSLDEKFVDDDESSSVKTSGSAPSARKKEVCPEKFMGKNSRYGYPFYRKGFERVNCSEFVPINQLVTMIVTLPEELSPEKQHQVFQGIAKYYPNIPITSVSNKEPALTGLTELKLSIKNVVYKDLTHGETWSKLLQGVTTPYVLFAPDITYFTDDLNLERLVRMLSENEDIIIAGGSLKNQRGEWDKDCLQLAFKNWTAYFRGGYYHSFNDCIVCDVLSGPFLAKTKELKKVGFDENLPFGAFQDMFWRLKLKYPEKVVISCPDVMFNTYERDIPDRKYAILAEKWDVKKWVESNGRVRWYGCRGARGHVHDRTRSCGKQKGLAVPPCDLENLADSIKFVMKACEDAGIYCELHEGSVLGVVKFSSVLPWERDADIKFLPENYTALQNLRPKFEAAGFRVQDEEIAKCCTDGRMTGGIILLFRNGWKVELYGKPMESELLVTSGQRPTKVMLDGQWVTVMRNPGLSARNRYGPNIYRHVEHWSVVGYSYGFQPYKSGSFTQCIKPGHSGCLDQFPPDGNLQFSDYPII